MNHQQRASAKRSGWRNLRVRSQQRLTADKPKIARACYSIALREAQAEAEAKAEFEQRQANEEPKAPRRSA